MTEQSNREAAEKKESGAGQCFAVALREFLGLPSAVAGGLLLAAATFVLDHAAVGWLGPVRTWRGHTSSVIPNRRPSSSARSPAG